MHTIARHLQILAAVLLTTAFAVPGHTQALRTPVCVVLVHGAFENSVGFAYATQDGITDLAQDVPLRERRVLFATQGPIVLSAFQGKVSHATWETKPSWSIIADDDRAISPAHPESRGVWMPGATHSLQH